MKPIHSDPRQSLTLCGLSQTRVVLNLALRLVHQGLLICIEIVWGVLLLL